jgi:hypothetical protein
MNHYDTTFSVSNLAEFNEAVRKLAPKQTELPDLPFNLVADEGQWWSMDAEMKRREEAKRQEQAQTGLFD